MSAEVNRKIAEALGLKVVPCPKEHHPGYCVEIPDDNPKYTNHKSVPDFHSPAVFWVEFEKWRASFQVNRPGFGGREEGGNDSPQERDYQFNIELWVNGVTLRGSAWRNVEASSKTSITEAGCACWLAALALGEGK